MFGDIHWGQHLVGGNLAVMYRHQGKLTDTAKMHEEVLAKKVGGILGGIR